MIEQVVNPSPFFSRVKEYILGNEWRRKLFLRTGVVMLCLAYGLLLIPVARGFHSELETNPLRNKEQVQQKIDLLTSTQTSK